MKTWRAPTIIELILSMEVTAYRSAEPSDDVT